MSNRSKILCLALASMMALGAIAASSASAFPRLTPDQYPAAFHAHGMWHMNLPGGRKVTCTKTLKGTIANKAEAEKGQITVTPTFTNCSAEILGVKHQATVTVNSCDTLLTFDKEAEGAIKAEGWEVTGSRHIKCKTPGDKIEIHIWQAGAQHTEPALCTYTVPEQGPNSSIDYKIVGGNILRIRTTITNTAVQRSGGTLSVCGAASQTATLEGESEAESSSEGEEEKVLGIKWDLP